MSVLLSIYPVGAKVDMSVLLSIYLVGASDFLPSHRPAKEEKGRLLSWLTLTHRGGGTNLLTQTLYVVLLVSVTQFS
jgi:hypothetical protein